MSAPEQPPYQRLQAHLNLWWSLWRMGENPQRGKR